MYREAQFFLGLWILLIDTLDYIVSPPVGAIDDQTYEIDHTNRQDDVIAI